MDFLKILSIVKSPMKFEVFDCHGKFVPTRGAETYITQVKTYQRS